MENIELIPIKNMASIIQIVGIYQTFNGGSRRFFVYIDSKRYYNEDEISQNIILRLLKEGFESLPLFSNVSLHVTNILYEKQVRDFDFHRRNGQQFSMTATVYPKNIPNAYAETISVPTFIIKGILLGGVDEAKEIEEFNTAKYYFSSQESYAKAKTFKEVFGIFPPLFSSMFAFKSSYF